MGHDVGPDLGATSPDELLVFFESEATLVRIGTVLGGLAAAFFLIWLGSLRAFLRLAGGRFRQVSDVAFAAGVVTATFYLIAVLCMAAPLFRDLAALDPATVAMFYSFRLLGEVLWFSPVPIAVFVAAVSFAVLAGRMLPRWTGRLGASVTAVALLSGLRPLADAALDTPPVGAGARRARAGRVPSLVGSSGSYARRVDRLGRLGARARRWPGCGSWDRPSSASPSGAPPPCRPGRR